MERWKQVGVLLSGLFVVMLIVRFTAYSQQPFWDIFMPWEYIFMLDLIPIEGFNQNADGQFITTEFRQGICVLVNFLIVSTGFWLASLGSRPNRRRVAQTAAFSVFMFYYLFIVVASMLGG